MHPKDTTYLKLGTELVDPGSGERLSTLLRAADIPREPGDFRKRTNLKLTGLPITKFDLRRIAEVVVS